MEKEEEKELVVKDFSDCVIFNFMCQRDTCHLLGNVA
jgi:hypothetical protein